MVTALCHVNKSDM